MAKNLLKKLAANNVDVINSAVFNGGFLIGGTHFDYREVKPDTDPELFVWREKFNKVCEDFGVTPARQSPLPYDVRFLPYSQYLLEPASGVWLLACSVLTSRGV